MVEPADRQDGCGHVIYNSVNGLAIYTDIVLYKRGLYAYYYHTPLIPYTQLDYKQICTKVYVEYFFE